MPKDSASKSDVPAAAVPNAMPTLRAAPCTPPDCCASRPDTAEATALFACEFTAPTPSPPKHTPTYSVGPTPPFVTPAAMSAHAAAMAANPPRMSRRDDRWGASFGRKVASTNIGSADSSEKMPV